MKIAIAADHGGFELKEILKPYLIDELKVEVIDFGTNGTHAVDYPDFAFLVADAVSRKKVDMGIMIDGVGVASAMVANKLPNIRAAVCNDLFSANSSRAHNNSNVLTLGARIIGSGLAKEIVKVWLNTEFETRHQGRIDKISRIEKSVRV
ncbi:MAG: ribose 5-phosphate isomerase B [Candidatus Sericytochromatia bacterium]